MEREIKRTIHIGLHVITTCYFWKLVNPSTDYNSLPTLAAVVLGGIFSFFLFESLKEAPPSHKEVDFMQPPRPWPKPEPQAPPKTDWELYLEDIYGEMPIDDLYEKWRDRVPRRPKKEVPHDLHE